MIRAIMWKEWREQRTIALAVMSFGVLALALTAKFADPTPGGSVWTQTGARELMAFSLAYLAGAVCGAVLLADEKEVGTAEFLDSLPSRRRELWIGKVLFGLLLVVAESAALALVAIAIGSVDERMPPLAYGGGVILVGLLAFGWGMFGGSLARSTLGAVFQGSLGSMAAAVILAVPFVMLFGQRAFSRPFTPVLMAYYLMWLGVGLVGSGAVFTSIDRHRRTVRAVTTGLELAPTRRIRGPGVRALVWLTARQAVYVALGTFGAGAVLGAAMLAPEVVPIFLWTGATLAFGVLAGVTTLGEEQTRGVGRFWAERRLPLGRLWLTKVSIHVAIAAAAALIAFLPLFAAVPSLPFRSRLLAGVDPGLRNELGRLLTLGLVYGFVVGHLAGMVFRKTIVAGLAAAVTAATFVAFILPGVIGGGASAWQVWGPAVVLLLTARLLLYPWATERVSARGPLLRTAAGLLLAAGVMGLALATRVYEVPDVSDRLAESGFERKLPPKDANVGGRDARAAVAKFRRAAQDAKGLYPGRPSVGGPGLAPPPPIEDADPLERVGRRGWNSQARVLEPWLDRVFDQDWPRLLDELPGLPLGVYDDPRDLDYFSQVDSLRDLWEMAAALRARGMQRQLAGDNEIYPRLLRGGLATARTARNMGGVATAEGALRAEEALLGGLAEWLGRLHGGEDLLRPLLAELVRHEREMPIGTEDAYWAEQLIVRNTLDRVGSWVPHELTPLRRAGEPVNAQAEAEADLVALAWTVPWERARRERILRVNTHPDQKVNPGWLSGLHLTPISRSARLDRLTAADRRGLLQRRFAQLKVALRLYQIDRGAAASELADLVPDYLESVPVDPFSGVPLRYRVSRGEIMIPFAFGLKGALAWNEFTGAAAASCLANPAGGLNGGFAISQLLSASQPRFGIIVASVTLVPPGRQGYFVRQGQGILWSTGPDGLDDGGHFPLVDGGSAAPGEDWITVVPMPVDK